MQTLKTEQQRLHWHFSCDNRCSLGAQPCSVLLYSKPCLGAAAWHWWSVIPTQGVAGLFLALSIRLEWGLLYWSCGLLSLPCISPQSTRRRALLNTGHTAYQAQLHHHWKCDTLPITSFLQSDMKERSGKEVFLSINELNMLGGLSYPTTCTVHGKTKSVYSQIWKHEIS